MSQILFFDTTRSIPPGDDTIRDLLKITRLSSRKILSDMINQLVWVILKPEHGNKFSGPICGSDYRHLLNENELQESDVAQFQVFKRDFLSHYRILFQAYEELNKFPSIVSVGSNQRFFCNEDDLWILTTSPYPDINIPADTLS